MSNLNRTLMTRVLSNRSVTGLTLAGLCLSALAGINGCATESEANGGAVSVRPQYVSSQYASIRNVMIVAGDEEPSAVYHARAMQNRIASAITGPLKDSGNRMFDHRGLAVEWDSGRRLSDKQLIDIAKNDVQEAIDVLVIFSTFVQTFNSSDETKARIRLETRMYEIPEGRHLGSQERSGEVMLTIPLSCNGFCYMEAIGDKARPLAQDIGQGVARQLAGVSDSFRLEFHGFSRRDTELIDNELRAFPGFKALRTTQNANQYWVVRYATVAPESDVAHNLRAMIDLLGMPGNVESTSEGFAVRTEQQ